MTTKVANPVLVELKKEYPGKFDVAFIDIREHPKAKKEFVLTRLPSHIFYDPEGKELYRHGGHFTKEQIVAKWKELKVL